MVVARNCASVCFLAKLEAIRATAEQPSRGLGSKTTIREISMPTIELLIFSPRWGHDDTYEIELERDHMEITRGLTSPEPTGKTTRTLHGAAGPLRA
jgi:hypothetical protein